MREPVRYQESGWQQGHQGRCRIDWHAHTLQHRQDRRNQSAVVPEKRQRLKTGSKILSVPCWVLMKVDSVFLDCSVRQKQQSSENSGARPRAHRSHLEPWAGRSWSAHLAGRSLWSSSLSLHYASGTALLTREGLRVSCGTRRRKFGSFEESGSTRPLKLLTRCKMHLNIYLDTSNNTASIIFWNGLLGEATSSKMKNRTHDEHAFGKERIALSVVVGQLKNNLNISRILIFDAKLRFAL